MKKHIWAVGLAIVVTGLLAACASPQQRANVPEALANMEKAREALSDFKLWQNSAGWISVEWNNKTFWRHDGPIILPANVGGTYVDLAPILGCTYEDDDWCYSKNFKYISYCRQEGCSLVMLHKDEIYLLSSHKNFSLKDGKAYASEWQNYCACNSSPEVGCKVCRSLKDYQGPWESR